MSRIKYENMSPPTPPSLCVCIYALSGDLSLYAYGSVPAVLRKPERLPALPREHQRTPYGFPVELDLGVRRHE